MATVDDVSAGLVPGFRASGRGDGGSWALPVTMLRVPRAHRAQRTPRESPTWST